MDRERINLCGQLAEVDQAMGFILAIIAGVALSFTATGLQRGALCAAIQGQAAAAPAVYPLRHAANSLVVGALGFFLGNCLAGFVSVLGGGVYFLLGWWKRRGALVGAQEVRHG